MKANAESLVDLNRSLLELTAILQKTRGGSNVPVELAQNMSNLFESVATI